MNGKIVRLERGDPKTAKIYEKFGDPLQTAKKWQADGAKKLHIIDLDAALGLGDNRSVIGKIAQRVNLSLQVGGGIRSFRDVEQLLESNIDQVILGSLPFHDSSALIRIIQRFGSDAIIVALDNKNGKVMIEGWKSQASMEIIESINKFLSMGIHNFLITSIARDGTLSGPDIGTLEEINSNLDLNIIAAGGIGKLEDLISLKRIGVHGVVIGKALYEGKFTLREALKKLGEK
ncbi:MAG: hypothetical protein AC479_00470 [miscellaneous Crenarchaeota group-6 archaeon AD8-1]|nr:MAG: hypothetical protein AC479_00470 [miscellaneous Crenarchaeota group-6 archaeon AD8-1]